MRSVFSMLLNSFNICLNLVFLQIVFSAILLANSEHKIGEKIFFILNDLTTCAKMLEWNCQCVKEKGMYFRAQCHTQSCFETILTAWVSKHVCSDKLFSPSPSG